MAFIVFFLSALALGSFVWTVIQVIKPDLFFKAEQEANLNRKRPRWYLFAGLTGIFLLMVLWWISLSERRISLWFLTGFFTIGALKPLGIVFFYDRFSQSVTKLVTSMKKSKAAYQKIVISRAILTVVLSASALYFAGMFGPVR